MSDRIRYEVRDETNRLGPRFTVLRVNLNGQAWHVTSYEDKGSAEIAATVLDALADGERR